MRLTRRDLAILLATAAIRPAWAQTADPIPLVTAIELTGAGSLAGDAWRNGVEMALQDINARGGILGRPIALTTYDAHAGTGVHAVMQRALAGEPYALLGPVGAPDALASLAAVRTARIMHVVGAEAASLTTQGDPTVMRAGIGEATGLAKLVAWARDTLHPARLGLLCDGSETGRAAREIVLRETRARGIEVAVDIVPPSRQTEFAADVQRLARGGVDAVFLDLGELETAHVLAELRRQALPAAVLGSSGLVTARVLKLAGAAANGARAHVGEAAEAPALADFRARYTAAYKQSPDEAAIQGHVAVGMVKAATELLGRLDPHALTEALRGQTVTVAREPAILFDSRWDQAGNVDHDSSIVEVQDGRLVLVRTLPVLA